MELPSPFPTFSDEVRARYPDLSWVLGGYENRLARDYEFLFRSRYIPEGQPGETLRDRVITAVLSAVTRARLLTWGVIASVNLQLPPVLYLSTRAHFEMAGFVAFLVKKLDVFFAGIQNPETARELDDVLDRLYLGTRFASPGAEGEHVEAIHVLKLVDSVDYLLRDDVQSRGEFRTQYEWLSEYCHPSYIGRLTGQDQDATTGAVSFDGEGRLRGEDVATALASLLLSHRVFVLACQRAMAHVGGLPEEAAQ